MIVTAVVAAAENDVIGAGGDLPWHLPADLRHFKELTSGHVVIMGRRTHESILARLGRPLPGRVSVVLTRTGVEPSDRVVPASSPAQALDLAAARSTRDEVFVIGGAEVFRLLLPSLDRVVLTRVHRPFDGDVRMPGGWLDGFTEVARKDVPDDPTPFSIITYERA